MKQPKPLQTSSGKHLNCRSNKSLKKKEFKKKLKLQKRPVNKRFKRKELKQLALIRKKD